MKAAWLVVCAMVPGAAVGQSPASTSEPAVAAAAGAFFALSVPDLEASTRWYAEKLDLKVVMRVPKTGPAAVTVLEGGRLMVELIQDDDALPRRTAAPAAEESHHIHGIYKAGLIVDDLDRTLAILKSRGVEIAFGPFPSRANQRANVIVRDNAGNLIQFFGK